MATTTVEKLDGRLMMAVPQELQSALQLEEGESLALTVSSEQVLVSRAPQYSLAQLIAEQEQIADQLEEDRAWLDAPRVGRELI